MKQKKVESTAVERINGQVLQLTRKFEEEISRTKINLNAEDRHYLATQFACVNILAWLRGMATGGNVLLEACNTVQAMMAIITDCERAQEVVSKYLPDGVWLPVLDHEQSEGEEESDGDSVLATAEKMLELFREMVSKMGEA